MIDLSQRRPALVCALAALSMLALVLAGCSSSSDVRSEIAKRFGVQPAPMPALPDPNTPVAAVEFLQGCWNNRDIAHYHEIFSDDYVFSFAAPDSAGNPYRFNPWNRDDELISAQHIFEAASSITLTFDGEPWADHDFRPGKTWPWHQQVQIANLTLTINLKDGAAYRITGGALFYMVRGDSAVIPQELEDRGFKPDTQRWYIERWEDQTSLGASPVSVLGGRAVEMPARTLPARKFSWGLLKALFR